MKHLYICCIVAVLLVVSVVTKPVEIAGSSGNGTPINLGLSSRQKREAEREAVYGKKLYVFLV